MVKNDKTLSRILSLTESRREDGRVPVKTRDGIASESERSSHGNERMKTSFKTYKTLNCTRAETLCKNEKNDFLVSTFEISRSRRARTASTRFVHNGSSTDENVGLKLRIQTRRRYACHRVRLVLEIRQGFAAPRQTSSGKSMPR